MTKATWSVFLLITPNTSWHNRPKRVSLYLAQKAGISVLSSWGSGVMLLFPTSLLQRNLSGHSPWGCRVWRDWATKQQQLLQISAEAEWGEAERSHSGGRLSPPNEGSWVAGQLPVMWSSCKNLRKIQRQMLSLSWLPCDPIPSLLCGLPERGQWDP